MIAAILGAGDPRAAAPAVELMRRTPAPLERMLPLVERSALDGRLPAVTLALVDALSAGADPTPPPDPRAEDGLAAVRPAWFSAPTHAAWLRLEAAMRADLGRAPIAASAYRSPTAQALLILWMWAEADHDVAAVQRRIDAPAQSEHCRPVDHAVDLMTARHSGAAFAQTDEVAWLRAHGPTFGFHETYAEGPRREPWHWRYRM